MPDRCVVAGCSNIPDSEKGIALHRIPFYGDERSQAKARRKKWTDFVKLKRAKQSPTASSAVCSCHFAPKDFTKRLSFSGQRLQRTLLKDEIGILPVPRFQRNTFEEEELSRRSRRQVSLLFCMFDHKMRDAGQFELGFDYVRSIIFRQHNQRLSLVLFPRECA